jgi:transketolase
LDILWVLYNRVLEVTPQTVDSPNRDRFVLSKGHSSLGLYAILADKGFITSNDLENFTEFSSMLGGHPDRTKVPGVEASTGSLGHGLPMAVGLALGMKIKKIPSKVYAIIGDGECNEGSIWEATMLASHHKLSNLYCIVDYNHSGDRALKLGDIRAKFESFGWHAISINGHDQDEIYTALKQNHDHKPVAIVAETIKGKGVKTMENNHEWHHKAPKPDELKKILQELDQ